jgi:hypothetical protein
MKIGENIVVVIDGDIKGAEVVQVLPDGNIQISVRDYYGDYLDFPRRQVFTASEWKVTE